MARLRPRMNRRGRFCWPQLRRDVHILAPLCIFHMCEFCKDLDAVIFARIAANCGANPEGTLAYKALES